MAIGWRNRAAPSRRRRALCAAAAILLVVPACASPRESAHVDDAIVVAAVGDLVCPPGAERLPGFCGDDAVAASIRADTAVTSLIALGDLQYETGSTEEFAAYDATFGPLRSMTYPVVGNHEYGTPDASGYFGYFGAAAHGPNGWYSFDLGTTWHVAVLNSNCAQVGCEADSAQVTWLRDDLAATTRPCTLAAWHHPRFSSGASHGSDPSVDELWRAVVDAGVDVVLTGHEHLYERFDPLDRAGAPASTGGTREFVVGTGGKSWYAFAQTLPGSARRISDEFGWLRLSLSATSYSWAFVPTVGDEVDSGSAACS